MSELCDIYNIKGNKTEKVFERGDALKDGQFQLVTDIWIINNNLQILIQKRSKNKKISPNIWATHGGCVATNETSVNGCIRESYEEIGIVLKIKDIELLIRSTNDNLIMDSYIVMQEFNISSAVLQIEEVSDIKWVSLNELEDMVKNKYFFNYLELPYVIKFINTQKSNRQL
ncbi:NUDIX domain-containing protein [Clostridium frigoris]|uniref:NUDIX domain-containing protein n=1 Tax=Clostridium frigoris TaxID=205327 RepID=A0ABS6BUY4_9CLOT|nr:NUDIX domain-containing protein [Clostridium frigoris]MBU3160627.1 NUDIX domain-containing protein [Clostridium frigoris]